MRRSFFLLAVLAFFLISCPAHAFDHGYDNQSDTICALVRHDTAVYHSAGGDFKEYLPSFSGIRATQISDSWYEVEYEGEYGTDYGYMTKEDFMYQCLVYDGREKQVLADGAYTFRYYTDTADLTGDTPIRRTFSSVLFTCQVIFTGDGRYQICRSDTGAYLLPDRLFQEDGTQLWGSAAEAGDFRLIRKGSFFGIQDTATNRYFGCSDAGLPGFCSKKDTAWRLNRTDKAVDTDSLRVFVQFDPDWACVYYGKGENPDPSTNNFCTSGCGVFAVMNAIYSLTGQYANPRQLADYAVDHYFRIEGNGTDVGFFKAAARAFGYKYGFRYDGSGESLEQLKKKLRQGDTAIVYVPGHYVTIVDYDKKKNRFLLLDPHYLPKRGTSSFGDWVSGEDLTEGNLFAQMFYYYEAIGN